MFNEIVWKMSELSKSYELPIPTFNGIFEPQKHAIERTVTVREDGSFCIAYVQDKLERPDENLNYTQKMSAVLQMHTEYGYVFKYTDRKNFFFGEYLKKYRIIGKRFFPKKEWFGAIRYEEGKRVVVKKGTGIILVQLMLYHLGLECMYNELVCDIDKIRMIFTNKQVLKGIFSGKITNLRLALKTWLASSCKLDYSDIRYSLLKDYLVYYNKSYPSDLIKLYEFTTDLEKAVKRIVDTQKKISELQEDLYSLGKEEYDIRSRQINALKDWNRLFSDAVNDAQMLDVKVNPEWSDKRLKKEHSDYSEAIMRKKSGDLCEAPIYDVKDTAISEKVNGVSLSGEFLNNEVSVFREGWKMHHCVYSGYFGSVKNKRYIVLSFTEPERVTVGIQYGIDKLTKEQKVVIDQMHTVGNGNPSNQFREAVNLYFEKNRDYFTSLLHRPETTDTTDERDERVVVVREFDELPF